MEGCQCCQMLTTYTCLSTTRRNSATKSSVRWSSLAIVPPPSGPRKPACIPRRLAVSNEALSSRGCSASYPALWRSCHPTAKGESRRKWWRRLAALKSLYHGFGYRELCRIIFCKVEERISDKTVKKLWTAPAPGCPQQLPLLDYHSYPERAEARKEVIELYCQGWRKTLSISRFMQVSRPTINEWIRRFETENLASLADKSSAPQSPERKVWLPVMLEVYHLQKHHPDAGRFRIWSVLGKPEISERTVGRVMALNKRLYPDIPHVRKKRQKQEPHPHPFKATVAHEYWFIDGRMMDFAIDGVRWWSLIVLDGYSRTMLAGAVVPSEASWIALTVLFTACRRYGVPQALISDKGGAYISTVFEAVCKRLGIDHKTITGKEGESYRI